MTPPGFVLGVSRGSGHDDACLSGGKASKRDLAWGMGAWGLQQAFDGVASLLWILRISLGRFHIIIMYEPPAIDRPGFLLLSISVGT